MREVELKEIRQKAHQYHGVGLRWHFHILSPSCVFNEKEKYAFVLECPERQVAIVHYSEKAQKELGQELAPLLHGSDVLDRKATSKDYNPTKAVLQMILRIKQLNNKGVEWHHHMLFPGCEFNTHSPEFALVLEDPETGKVYENITDEEPTNDLKQIETLFYKE